MKSEREKFLEKCHEDFIDVCPEFKKLRKTKEYYDLREAFLNIEKEVEIQLRGQSG